VVAKLQELTMVLKVAKIAYLGIVMVATMCEGVAMLAT
jgi:energy-converting hydrogenase Eha subunit C